MPTYTTPPTATAGGTLSATDFNAGVRDNLTILGGAWTAYTPTWTSTGTAPVLGNGSIAGRYRLFGKTLDLRITITMGTTTTYGAAVWLVTLPSGITTAAGGDQILPTSYSNVSIANYHGPSAITAGSANIILTVDVGTAGGALQLPTGTVPFTWGTGDTITVQGTIEVA